MSRKPEQEKEEMLSFAELKDQMEESQSAEQTDAEMDALLADLKEIAETLEEEPKQEKEKEASPSAQKTSAKAEDESTQQAKAYKSIYSDVLQSMMQTEEHENTNRKNKYMQEEGQFVDVTEDYNTYGSTVETEEEAPLETYAVSPKAEPPTAVDPALLTKEYRSFGQMMQDFFHSIFPTKGDSVGEGIRKVVMDISVIALVCCAVYFGVYAVQSHGAKKQQAELEGYVMPDGIGDIALEGDAWAQFRAQYPNTVFPEGMMQKYAYLYAINPELVGWVNVPNSMINVQVVQSEAAIDEELGEAEYLHKDFYGNYSRYGTPYMDYRNDPKYLNRNTTIYAHHMSDGLMFADLKKYKTIEGFKEAPVFYFDTLYKRYAFKVYAVIISNAFEEDDNGYAFNYTVPNFQSADHFMSYVSALDERKLYTTGVDIGPEDKLLTLSTCTYEFKNARLAVVGRMVRDGESEEVDVTKAVANPSPRYPQAWYDAKHQTNPYAGAPQWVYGA